MAEAKEKIYLTDITLHVRGFRPTLSFAKVAERGRMYSSLSTDQAKNIDSTSSGTIETSIALPKDLSEKINRDEVKLMMPKDGLYIYAGKDLLEYIAKQERAKSKPRTRTWHKEK